MFNAQSKKPRTIFTVTGLGLSDHHFRAINARSIYAKTLHAQSSNLKMSTLARLKVTGDPQDIGGEGVFPCKLWKALKNFLLDGKSGNVTLNITNGRIRALRIEHVVSLHK